MEWFSNFSPNALYGMQCGPPTFTSQYCFSHSSAKLTLFTGWTSSFGSNRPASAAAFIISVLSPTIDVDVSTQRSLWLQQSEAPDFLLQLLTTCATADTVWCVRYQPCSSRQLIGRYCAAYT